MKSSRSVRFKRMGKRALKIVRRPVRCETCDAVLFDGFPLVWRGRVKLVGAECAVVRVDFDSMNRLVFRHVEADRCRRAAERREP